MSQSERIVRPSPSTLEPLPLAIFFTPLDAIGREHTRQIKVSEWILEHASAERIAPFREAVEALLGFFCRDLVLHHEDEEKDLFPMLQERCQAQDSIDLILAELVRDHASEGFLMRDIVADLHRLVERRDLESASRFFASLRYFAEGQQRHVAWENEAVLPLARRRLTDIDLTALGSSMVARRERARPK